MNWNNQLLSDIKYRILRFQYILIVPITILCCMSCQSQIQDISVDCNWIDYWLFIFKGTIPLYLQSPGTEIAFPTLWVLVISCHQYINLEYLVSDQNLIGQQRLVRQKKRSIWFLTKCFGCMLSCLLYFTLIGCTILVYVMADGGAITLNNTPAITLAIYSDILFEPISIQPYQAVMASIINPLLTILAFGILQTVLSMKYKPITSFMACLGIQLLSVNVQSPYLLGNGAMAIRSAYIAPDGIHPRYFIPTIMFFLFACVYIGNRIFKSVDILWTPE